MVDNFYDLVDKFDNIPVCLQLFKKRTAGSDRKIKGWLHSYYTLMPSHHVSIISHTDHIKPNQTNPNQIRLNQTKSN